MTEDPSMKDRAAESAQVGKQAAVDVASTATDKAQDVVTEAKSQARDLVGEARGQLRGQAGEQQRSAVANLRSLGQELQRMAENSEQSGLASDLIGQAAGHAHDVAGWLDGREPEQVLDDVRRLARRRPGAFLLGALAAGVVAGRLTRGVVAEHQQDDAAPSTRPTSPAPVGTAQSGRHTLGSATTPSLGVPDVNEQLR